MTDTTKVQGAAEAAAPDPGDAAARAASAAKKQRTTSVVVALAFILVIALFLFMVTRPPREDPSPTSIGFSLNSFFQWLGSLGPILQIPIILLVFGILVGVLLLLIEYAPRVGRPYFWLRLIACFAIPLLAFMMLRPYQGALIYVLAIAVILGGVLFYADYRAAAGPGYLFQLVLFMAPATILLLVGLIYPAIATIIQSFFDKTGENFVGWENYIWAFTNPQGFWSMTNTIIWVLVVPVVATTLGLACAVFIDRARGEKLLKILIFMSFGISFVGAGIIWELQYDYRQGEQIGIFNAIVVGLGGEPVPWLAVQPFINTFFVMVVFIWSQTGLAMVILSAAIKAVPAEQMEAAELDGTNAWQRFRNVTLPGIRPSIVVVLTTIAIGALKIYDVVAVMTGGRSNTTVLAFEMVNQQQRFQSYGHAAALAVVLMILVIPLIVFNVIQIRKQREIR